MCKDACFVQGEVWTVAHGCGAIRAAVILLRALSALVLVTALATVIAATMPMGALGASTSAVAKRATACPGAGLQPSRTNTLTIDAATLCLIDQARTAHGLHPLLINRELQAVAISQVKDMVRLDYFSDTRPSGKTPAALIAATPYGHRSMSLSTAESIGWGIGRFATPMQMVAGWLASAAHRAIVLSGELFEAGIGSVAAAPSRLAHGHAGATYALELARR